MAELPTPESQSTLKDELAKYLPDAELQKVLAHRGDKEALILSRQCDAIRDLYNRKLISEYWLTFLVGTIDDLVRVQGALKRIKNYPYARNYYSIAVFLVMIFVAIVPFGLFPHAQELGKPAGIERWTVWLNVPFSAIVGWVFVSLEKVGENSSNPFEGGANDVPISFIARRIEIEMRTMLGEADRPQVDRGEGQHPVLARHPGVTAPRRASILAERPARRPRASRRGATGRCGRADRARSRARLARGGSLTTGCG